MEKTVGQFLTQDLGFACYLYASRRLRFMGCKDADSGKVNFCSTIRMGMGKPIAWIVKLGPRFRLSLSWTPFDIYISQDEQLDLVWVCERLRSTDYYDMVTADIQCLHGIIAGITSDGIITVSELEGLSQWLEDHDHLRGSWPYEEVGSLVTAILADKKVDQLERQLFLDFCSNFVSSSSNRAFGQPIAPQGIAIKGVCAVCPEISFPNSRFCFTGESKKYTRQELAQIVEELKGIACESVRQDLDYLVIGGAANPCWAYACYGRKVEKAVELRKKGFNLLLVHENDFLARVYHP